MTLAYALCCSCFLPSARPSTGRSMNLNCRGPDFNFPNRLSTRILRDVSPSKHDCHHHETEISTLGRSSAQTASTSWIRLLLNAAISAASPALPSSIAT